MRAGVVSEVIRRAARVVLQDRLFAARENVTEPSIASSSAGDYGASVAFSGAQVR